MSIPGGRRFTLLVASVLLAVITAAYGNSLGIGFHFDDAYGIDRNEWIRDLRNTPRFFADPFTLTPVRANVDVRPVLQTTFALNYAISGLRPWSWHVFNLIVHLGAALMVFLIVRDHLWFPTSKGGRREEGRFVAAGAALFFAVAPLNTQPLDYMWARSALLCSALYLAAFLFAIRQRPIAAAVFHALALLTKAVAVTLPAALLLHRVLYRDRDAQPTITSVLKDWRGLLRLLAVPVALNLAYLVYRQVALPGWAEASRHETFVTPWTWWLSQWPAHVEYVRLFLWPDSLNVDHGFPYATGLLSFRTLLSGLALLCWIALALRAANKRPHVAFATLWFFLALFPESSFAPLAEVINDHRPYLASSLGLSLLLSWLLWEIAERMSLRRGFVSACAALTLVAVPLVRHRNGQWHDPLILWQDSVEKSPHNARSWQNLGVTRMGRGDLDGARRALERARELGPRWAYTHMNLAVLAMHEGRLADALAAADDGVRTGPGIGLSHYYRGQALAKLGRTVEARQAYRRALEVHPGLREAEAAIGELEAEDAEAARLRRLMDRGMELRYEAGDAASAAEIFRSVLERMPEHYGATYQLAAALDAMDRRDEARPLWEKMLRMAREARDPDTEKTARERLTSGTP